MTKQAPEKSGSPGAPVELETGPDEKRAWQALTQFAEALDGLSPGDMSAAPVIWTYTKTHIAARLNDFITLGAYMRAPNGVGGEHWASPGLACVSRG